MTPARSKAHLAFIRSLACIVCKSTRNVEAAHAPGTRGMSQKRSDFETLPLCRIHHQEQHRIGWKRFIETYELDVQWWLEHLRQKPHIQIVWEWVRPPLLAGIPGSGAVAWRPARYIARYCDASFQLMPITDGLKASIKALIPMCREYLIAELFNKERTTA